IEAYKKRMGWNFKWVSSLESDFNYDYQVSFSKDEITRGKVYYNFEMRDVTNDELSGISVFYKNANDDVFHTYSTYARGGEGLIGTYHYLDLTPKGRNETGPRRDLTDWVRHHDRYSAGGFVQPSGRYQAAGKTDSCCHAMENH